MTMKLRVLCVLSALCFLGSLACFSGYAAELIYNTAGEDENFVDPGYTDPGYVDPGTTSYVDPGYVDPGTTSYVDPGYVDPGTTSYVDPGYVDPGTTSYVDPGETSEPTYSATVSDVISEGNFPQNDPDATVTESQVYVNNTSQYNQFVLNTYQAVYDDNYYYVPSYTAPEESLIDISSKEVDTDELTSADWNKIMLDLSQGNVSGNDDMTFNFIKDNEDQEDTSVSWMLYLGIILILASVLTVVFVIITTNKEHENLSVA